MPELYTLKSSLRLFSCYSAFGLSVRGVGVLY